MSKRTSFSCLGFCSRVCNWFTAINFDQCKFLLHTFLVQQLRQNAFEDRYDAPAQPESQQEIQTIGLVGTRSAGLHDALDQIDESGGEGVSRMGTRSITMTVKRNSGCLNKYLLNALDLVLGVSLRLECFAC